MKLINLDNYIKYHIKKEFKNTFINESQGKPDDIDIWVDLLYDDIIKMINPYKGQYVTFNKTVSFKYNNVFFDKCDIQFMIIIDDSDPNSNLSINPGGGYYPEYSGIDNNNEYVINLYIYLNGTFNSICKELKPLLAHELTHAYTDYKINSNTLIKDKKINSKINNKELYNLMFDKNEYLVNLYNVIYFSLNSEINAMQSEIFMEMFKKRGLMTNNFNANDILTNTKVYTRLKNIENRFNELKLLKDKKIQNDVLNEFNKIFYSNISNYNDMLIKLNTIWNKSRNKLISAACKMAQNVYNVKNIHTYSDD